MLKDSLVKGWRMNIKMVIVGAERLEKLMKNQYLWVVVSVDLGEEEVIYRLYEGALGRWEIIKETGEQDIS